MYSTDIYQIYLFKYMCGLDVQKYHLSDSQNDLILLHQWFYTEVFKITLNIKLMPKWNFHLARSELFSVSQKKKFLLNMMPILMPFKSHTDVC